MMEINFKRSQIGKCDYFTSKKYRGSSFLYMGNIFKMQHSEIGDSPEIVSKKLDKWELEMRENKDLFSICEDDYDDIPF